jgi:hypothetical protein
MSKGENIVKWVKGQRIRLLGHLERMEEDRTPKKIFTQELEGSRRKGRPRKRWEEEVERDLQVLGVRRWRKLMTDRRMWKDIVRQGQSPLWTVQKMEEEEETTDVEKFVLMHVPRSTDNISLKTLSILICQHETPFLPYTWILRGFVCHPLSLSWKFCCVMI